MQKGCTVKPLSAFLGTATPAPANAIDPPKWEDKAATGTDFIRFLKFSLQFIDPIDSKKALLDELAAICVGAGKAFDLSALY